MATLPILRTTVAIPAFHALGYDPATLPDQAAVDGSAHFDPRAYPGVLDAARGGGAGLTPVGIWTCDTIAYAEASADVACWAKRRYASEITRRRAFWRAARPQAITERLVAKNVITDFGALALLKVIASAAPTQFFNHVQLATGAATAQLSGAMSSTGVTAIPVIAGGTSFTNGMSVTLGYGTPNAETVTVGSGSTGTSIVCSATTKTHSANDWVVQNPVTSDNPSSVSNGYDSGALAAGAFAYSGASAGNRQVVVTYNFPANGSAPGSGYTDLWLASAATIATNTTAAHLTRSPMILNATTGANISYTDSL